jgi:hypothetical protein
VRQKTRVGFPLAPSSVDRETSETCVQGGPSPWGRGLPREAFVAWAREAYKSEWVVSLPCTSKSPW